jgi:hypothetical protein
MDDSNPQKQDLEIKKKHLDDFKEYFGENLEVMMEEKFPSIKDFESNTPIQIQANVEPMFGKVQMMINSRTLINEWVMTADLERNYFNEFYGTFDISSFFSDEEDSQTKTVIMMTEDSDFSIVKFISDVAANNEPDPESINGMKLFVNLGMGLKLFHKEFFMCLLNYNTIVFKDVTALKLKDTKARFILSSNGKKYTAKFADYNFATSATGPDCHSHDSSHLPLDENARGQKLLRDLTGLVVWVLDYEFALAGIPHLYSEVRGLASQLCKGVAEDHEMMIEQMSKRLSKLELIQKGRFYSKHELLEKRFKSIGGMQEYDSGYDLLHIIKKNPQHIDSIMMHVFLEHIYQTSNMKDLPKLTKIGVKQRWNQMLFELLITNFEGQTDIKKLLKTALTFKKTLKETDSLLKRNLKLNNVEINDSTKGVEQSKEASMGEDPSMDRLSENNKNSDLTPSQNESKIIKNRLVIV